MDYQGHLIRPPSEAASTILQVTVGCSHNRCTFCGAYKDVTFRIKDEATVHRDLKEAYATAPQRKTLFLADGDVLSLSHKRLTRLFLRIHEEMPSVRRIRLYGSAKSVLSKNNGQLQEYKKNGLDRVYLGLESGYDPILQAVCKWGSSEKMVRAAEKLREANIFLSTTVLLGLGGRQHSDLHAHHTAQILNRMQPQQIAALTLMLVPGTPLFQQYRQGTFAPLSPKGILIELKHMLSKLKDVRTLFMANHASNHLPLNGRLPKDTNRFLEHIDRALAGEQPLMPNYMRAL